MAKILDGRKVAATLKEKMLQQFSSLKQTVKLTVVHFNDPASASYLKGRKKICEFLGVSLEEIVIDNSTTMEQISAIVNDLNNDYSVDGIMIDRPLPSQLDENKVLSLITPSKDVDGYTFPSLGKLLSNQKTHNSCTPAAAIYILDYYNIDLAGKNVVVVGRSVNVGKPLALMLLNKNATVTIAHSKTKDLHKITKKADVIFTCVGKHNFIKKQHVSKKTIIVDIGINFDENGKLCGDTAAECYDYVKAYSPVPGGVGVITNLMLMNNLYTAHLLKENNEDSL